MKSIGLLLLGFVALELIPPSDECVRTRRTCFSLNCPGGSHRHYYFTASHGSTSQNVYWSTPSCTCGSFRQTPSIRQGQRLSEGTHYLRYYCTDDCGHCGNCHIWLHVSVRRCYWRPSPPSNGRLTYCPNNYGSRCHYTCDSGYARSGSYPYCTYFGYWQYSGGMSCRRLTCPGRPSSILNGFIRCSGNTYGSTCEYGCNDGYKIPRSSKNYHRPTCTYWSYWSSGIRPECFVDKDPEKYCHCDIDIKTSFVPVSVDLPRPLIRARGNDLPLTCSHGTKELLSAPETVVRCRAYDYELGRSSECRQLITIKHITCKPLTPPENGQIIGLCENGHQSTCRYTCNTGYLPGGSTEVTCQEDETWSVTPLCNIKNCTEPPRILNGSVNCSNSDWPYGSSCRYECDAGFTIPRRFYDNSILTCDSEANWDPINSPHCWCKENRSHF